jgi:hypothetical protein
MTQREVLTSWGHGRSGNYVIETEQRDIFTFYRVREYGRIWPQVYQSSLEAERAVEQAEQKSR